MPKISDIEDKGKKGLDISQLFIKGDVGSKTTSRTSKQIFF